MKKLKLRTSVTVFLLFFGISLLEAFRTRNWINVVFWLGIAAMFLIADNLKEDKPRKTEGES
jgi:hypothetical protein